MNREDSNLKDNHHKMLGALVLTLVISGFVPFVVSPVVSTISGEAFYSPSSITWQTFNRDLNVTTFTSPDGSRDALWHFLNSAQESIYVEIYGINHPHILNLIHEISAAKPSLEMKFLIGWNSLGYVPENRYVANNLTLLGYPVKWTTDEFTFAHQKYVIIDNKTTIVHSGNWAKTSFPEYGYKANREWSIAMTDTEITAYYRSVFDYDWGNGIEYNATVHGTGTPLTQPTTTSTYTHPFATPGHFSGPMNVTPIFSPDTSLEGILYCINAAQATLDIQIPYFTSVGNAGAVDTVLAAIIAAKQRGVTVRVISEEEYNWQEVAEMFHEHQIPIVWQDTRWFMANHNKGIIVDGRIVLISSINYSDGSISSNREAGVIIENEDVAKWYLEVYDYDWGLADADEMSFVNLYWDPNIPTSTSQINVTVYAHGLYPNIDNVSLGVKIGSGSWENYTITENVFDSAEGDPESFYHVIAPQPDGTNITVQATVFASGVKHVGFEMVIPVRDSIGSVITTPTGTIEPDWLMELIKEFLPYIVIAVIVIIGGIIAKKRH